MLREVTDLPTFHSRGRKSKVIPDVRAFIASDMRGAVIAVPGVSWRNIYHAAKEYVKRHSIEGVGVHVKGGTVYLVREVEE
jgi:hypothetical protein